MIEHTIQNNPYAALMCFCHQLCKQGITCFQISLIRHPVNITGCKTVLPLIVGKKLSLITDDPAKMGINIVIILNIVFVVGRGHKQGIEINNINTQILQIIHLVKNTLQITAIKFTDAHGCRIFLPVIHLHCLVTDILIFPGEYIIGRISVIKPVYIDLIHNSTLGPLRCLKPGNDTELILWPHFLHYTSRIIKAVQLAGFYNEIIGKLCILQFHFTGKVFKIFILGFPHHQMPCFSMYKKDSVYIIYRCPETDHYM